MSKKKVSALTTQRSMQDCLCRLQRCSPTCNIRWGKGQTLMFHIDVGEDVLSKKDFVNLLTSRQGFLFRRAIFCAGERYIDVCITCVREGVPKIISPTLHTMSKIPSPMHFVFFPTCFWVGKGFHGRRK